jgi:hypothetical protein
MLLMMNLVSEWKFDGTTIDGSAATNNDVLDTWSGLNNGIIPTAPAIPTVKTGSNCVSGSCLNFNGNDYVDLTAEGGLVNSFTISMWFNTSNISNIQRLINWRPSTGDSNEIRFNINESKLEGLVMHSSGSPTGYKDYLGAVTLQSNNWYLGTFSWNGTDFKLYLNGNENVPYVKTKDDSVSMTNTIRNRRFGAAVAGVDFFTGLIDDVRIYNAGMPTSQIKEQYYAGLNSLLSSGQITKEDYQNRLVGIK